MPSTSTRLDDRILIRVSGEDPRGFLQGLVTQDVATVAPGQPRWSGLLTAQGKALFDFILWDDGDSILIDCETSAADALAKRLALYRLRRAIEIAPAAGGVHWSPEAQAGLDDPRLAALGSRWLGDGEGDSVSDPWREYRLRLGVVEGAAELGQDATLWLECNAQELGGVSFVKGCYIGQENTARMNYRSTVNRRLIVAPLADPGPRTRASYPDLGLMVEHRRIDALSDALRPDWLATAIG